MADSYHLCQQFILAALYALAHAVFLRSVLVARFAVADCHLAFVGRRGVLVTDGALGHSQLALKGR